MSNLRIATLITAFALGLGGGARAAEEADNETRAERQKAAHELRMRRLTERRLRQISAVSTETRRFECRIESLLDETLMVSAPYESKAEPALLRFGYRKVYSPPDHQAKQLYDGRVYQIMQLGPGVTEAQLADMIGQTVELELQKVLYTGGSRVVAVREMPGAKGK